jgi:hypothetical protein
MKNYKSKLGLELIIPISLIFGYALFELITEKSWFGVFIISLTIIFILYTFLSINYKIEKENLLDENQLDSYVLTLIRNYPEFNENDYNNALNLSKKNIDYN